MFKLNGKIFSNDELIEDADKSKIILFNECGGDELGFFSCCLIVELNKLHVLELRLNEDDDVMSLPPYKYDGEDEDEENEEERDDKPDDIGLEFLL